MKLKIYFLRTLFCAILSLFSFNAFSTHTAGLEIFYRWTPQFNSDSTYEFTLIFYRNCQGFASSAPVTMTINASAPSIQQTGTFTLARLPTSGNGVPPLEPPNLYNCTLGYSSICYEEYVYRGNWTSPKRASDWTFASQICCRPGPTGPMTATNIDYSSHFIQCGLNNKDFPDQKNKNWSTVFHNRRPNHPGHLTDTIISPFMKSVCAGNYYTIDQSAREYQGDSVSYNFYWPQGTSGAQITYLSPWSFTNPLPVATGSFVINPHTGLIPYTAGQPSGNGIYIIGIESKEWRKDTIVSGTSFSVVSKMIGYNRRELIVMIDDSTTCRKDSAHIKDISLDTTNADSLLQVHFHNGTAGHPNSLVRCASLSADGSEFRVIDSTTNQYIGVLGASWTCHNGLTNRVTLKLSQPIFCGDYYILIRKGTDLDEIQSECGFWEPAGSYAKIITDDVIQPNLGPNDTVCKWTPFSKLLYAGPNYASYYWNTWATGKTLLVNTPGTYWVEVTNNFGCKASDTLKIFEKICDTSTIDTTKVGIKDFNSLNMKLFPNPANGYLNIMIKNHTSYSQIDMYNSSGANVLEIKHIEEQMKLDVSHYPEGIYIISLQRRDGTRLGKKVQIY